MDYMMHAGLLAHKYLIYSYIAVLFFHLFKLLRAEDVSAYRKFMLIYNPMLVLPTLGGVLLSGLVMFTAIHFEFNIANSVMIIAAVGLVMHEFKRAKELRYTTSDEFPKYKKRAMRYLLTNLALIFVATFIGVKFS